MIVAIQPESCEMTQVHDSTIALTTVELAAVHKGLGTFWCGFFAYALSNKDVAAKVGIPAGFKAVSVLGIGKSDVQFLRPVLRENISIQFVDSLKRQRIEEAKTEIKAATVKIEDSCVQ